VALEQMSLGERRSRSALVIAVPDVAHIIGGYRRAHTEDGSSVPSHITLLSPFLAPAETTASVRQRVANVGSRFPSFEFQATKVNQFPTGVMYLALEPVGPFLELISRLRKEFPEVTPYWDQFDQVVPHITVADSALTDAPDVLRDIASNVSCRLPVHCTAREIVLIQRVRPAPAPWDNMGRFSLN
jgi:2'-5' RNA ligase